MTAERSSRPVRFDVVSQFPIEGLTCPIAPVLLRLPSSRGSSIGSSATGFENSLLPDFSLRKGLHMAETGMDSAQHLNPADRALAT